MVELVDAVDSKSSPSNRVLVRVQSSALFFLEGKIMILNPQFRNLDPTPLFPLETARGGWRKGMPRPFQRDVDGDERGNIRYILEKLSKKSLISLFKYKKELKKRGDRIEHVHPLTFLIGALSPDCSGFFYALKRRKGIPFDEFLKGVVESFHDEARHGNITEKHIQIFAQKTNRCVHQVRAFVHSRQWKDFIHWL